MTIGTYRFESADDQAHQLVVQVESAQPLTSVNTRVWPKKQDDRTNVGLNVGGQSYAGDPPTSSSGLQVVVLDRATGGEPHDGTPVNQTFATDSDGLSKYTAFLGGLDGRKIVLVTGVVPNGLSPDGKRTPWYVKVWTPLFALGAVGWPDVAVNATSGTPFSFIGVPGTTPGSAWRAVGSDSASFSTPTRCDPTLAGYPANNLSGWLTLDTTGLYMTYVSSDYVTFDTDYQPTSGTHTILLGDAKYSAPTTQFNGFHAVMLERSSLQPLRPPFNKCYDPTSAWLSDLADDLAPHIGNRDRLLILAPTVGDKGAATGNAIDHGFVVNLRHFGASPCAPGRSLDTAATRYALVGAGGSVTDGGRSAAESFTEFGQTGHIVGELVRDRQNRFVPQQADRWGHPVPKLAALVYGPASPWPSESAPELKAAYEHLTTQLGVPISSEHPEGVRSLYPEWLDGTPTTGAAVLTDAKCDGAPDADACKTVLMGLRREYHALDMTAQFLTRLRTAYFETEGENEGEVIVKTVEQEVKSRFPPPPQKKASLWAPLVNFVLSVASAIPAVGPAFKVAGAMFNYGLSLARDVEGNNSDPLGVMYDDGDKLLVAADTGLSGALKIIDNLFPLIVADYEKLDYVGHMAATSPFPDGSDYDQTPWALTQQDVDQIRTGLESALMQWLYPALVDAAFPPWRVKIPSGDGHNDGTQTPVTYRCGDKKLPFGEEPAAGWLMLSDGSTPHYLALGGTEWRADQIQVGHHPTLPSATLLKYIFTAMPDGVGLNRTWYFEQAWRNLLDSNQAYARTVDCYPTSSAATTDATTAHSEAT